MLSAKKKVLIISFLYYHKICIHAQIWHPLQPGVLGGCLGGRKLARGGVNISFWGEETFPPPQ